jgi:CRP/FNR family transcriptional regulator, cyclic AMP receptor protein
MPDLSCLEVGFLTRLSPAIQKKLLDHSQIFQFHPGEIIFQEGDPSLYLYILESGTVALEFAISPAKRVILTTVNAGQAFSWSTLSNSRFQTASARALTDVEALGVQAEDLDKLFLEDTQVGIELYRALCEVLSGRLTAMRSHLQDKLGNSEAGGSDVAA